MMPTSILKSALQSCLMRVVLIPFLYHRLASELLVRTLAVRKLGSDAQYLFLQRRGPLNMERTRSAFLRTHRPDPASL